MNTFDYIIIGAGSAGCVLANRLSENPENTVLLVEAGGPDSKNEIKIPGAYSKLHRSEVDWAFWTEPQEHVGGRKIFIPRGKTLGGCSSTNAMAYVRGNSADYDEWAAMGNKGWSYKDLLPYFKRSEKNHDFKGAYYGEEGPLHVKLADEPHFLGKHFIEACAGSGIPVNPEYNGKEQLGASLLQYTIFKQQRQSTATAFLKPVLNRKNLIVKTKLNVSKILIDNNIAIGIETIDLNKNYINYLANKEVIVSAGSIKTPQILMLSGIGDSDYLKNFGIETKHNLPGVGKNLQDHIWSGVSTWSSVNTDNHGLNLIPMTTSLLKYLFFKNGPLTNGPLTANAFLNLNGNESKPDIQFHFAVSTVKEDYSTDIYDIHTFPKDSGFSIMVILLHPKSRGFIGLKDDDPFSAPLIQPNLLSEKEDLNLLIKGLAKAKEVMGQESLKQFRKGEALIPSSFEREGIEAHIQKTLETLYHPVGTCKMGNDEMSVVDSDLKVYGIQNLRIADASIMPKIISGNTNAACIMIGEKASDLILSQ
ncbi:MAG: choline dehydrogenase [Mongoliibacter sp.]|uniref:GMC family oxidoreductase n=1 Tax=Mongoliibacter sp. TaxID=2022438 RepID=UPI0012EF3A6C|nr:GMC family oxidoreductase N-terminal domain-containing protein [Mongoliibacter sp.]TVP51698.1 MAG: choline dehydrogenase [Mongoliibacter sp.]